MNDTKIAECNYPVDTMPKEGYLGIVNLQTELTVSDIQVNQKESKVNAKVKNMLKSKSKKKHE